MKRCRRLWGALLTLLTALAAGSCGEARPLELLEPANSGQISWGAQLTSSPSIYVLVVDDQASAATVRAEVKVLVEEMVARELIMRHHERTPSDPAAWHPGDSRVVVVRPSAHPQDWLITSVQQPGLDWTSNYSTADEAEAWLESIIAALTPPMDQRDGEAYELLARTYSALTLINGTRYPANADEQVFVDNLPADEAMVGVFIASAHDDTSPLAPSSYYFSRPSRWEISVLAPESDDGCEPTTWATPRLAEWVELQTSSPSDATIVNSPDDSGKPSAHWSCTHGWFDLSLRGSVSWASRCMDRPIAVDPTSGVADCSVTLETENLDRCPEERGWFDPAGEATIFFSEKFGRQLRLCVLPQLEGPRLQSCRHSFECPDCGHGWCATEVSDLLDHYCAPPQSIPVPLRFVGGGINTNLNGIVTVTCNTAQ